MRMQYRFHFLVAVALLGGCIPPAIAPVSPVESIPPTALATMLTSMPAEPPATFTPTWPAPTITSSPVGPAATSTVALPPESTLRYQPLEVTSNLSSDVKPAGDLLVWEEQPHLLRFNPQLQLEDLPGIDIACLSTSPNGQWIAYCVLSEDSPTGQWLIVESADRQQHYQVPIDLHLAYFGAYEWLDNQRLVFPFMQEIATVYPVMIINPFIGKQTELGSDYPGISGTVVGPIGRLAFEYSSLVYHPSLNLVIFPEMTPQRYIVLWDRQSNSVLAKVEDKGEFLNYPLWSPDAKQFVVAVRKDDGNSIEEWFGVSREGQVEQLTHFGDYFADAEIGHANWSPDGQKLAFWLETSSGLCSGTRLDVLELATRQVTNTCIPGSLEFAPPPIWSLNSRYIAVINADASPDQTILVDLERGRAYDITNYGSPVGWLALP